MWHAVGPGSGFRFSFTLFDHEVCTYGVRPQDGYVMDWSKHVDARPEDERYEPDIPQLVKYAAEYARHKGGRESKYGGGIGGKEMVKHR